MKQRLNILLATCLLMVVGPAFAQSKPLTIIRKPVETAEPVEIPAPTTGPVIEGFGPVYEVVDDAYNLKPGKKYKVLMDLSASGEFVMDNNSGLESAARFLNMHAQNGIDAKDLKLTVVVHGAATKDMLSDNAYRKEFGVFNPNTRLIDALHEAGVRILVCGQSAAHSGFVAGNFNEAVEMSLSAMSAHIRLQSEGYNLIPF